MSGKIAGLVWDMLLPVPEKYVLLALADHADHEGYGIRPSYDLIAWKTGYNKRHVIRLVGKLEAKCILIMDKHGGISQRGKVNTANEWHIDVEAAPKTPARLKRVVTPRTLGSDSQDTRVVTPRTPQPLWEPSENRKSEDSVVASLQRSANGKKPPSAKATQQPTPRVDKAPRKARPIDVWLDAIAKVAFKGVVSSRTTWIVYGNPRVNCGGLLAYECERQSVTKDALDYSALATDVALFWRAYQIECPDKSLIDCVKWDERWRGWRATSAAQTGHYEEQEISPGAFKKVWIPA